MTVISYVVYMRSDSYTQVDASVQNQRLAMASNSKFQDREMKKMGTFYQQAQ